MTHDELLAEIDSADEYNYFGGKQLNSAFGSALRAVVELHKPYDSQDTPHEIAIGWCKGCSIVASVNKYASHIYPCPTIQAIEKELK